MIASPPTNHRFQPEIQGLRAIAILLVVLAHAGVPGMGSGFIGVDIFFVISGYLITGLIVREMEQTKTFAFTEFFIRRIRRLFPALLTMLILVSLASVLLLSPFEQTSQSISAGYASVWVSNIYFAFSNLGYFEASTETNLFLHTWSLGVEEQFYLIWPVLIFMLYKVGPHAGTSHKKLLLGLAVILLVSLAASIYLSSSHPLWGFYLMPSRAWQFAVGAIVMLYVSNSTRNVSDNVFRVATVAGLLCIAVSLALIKKSSLYPGLWALIPTIGTALILIGCSCRNQNPVSSFLQLQPMQKLGDLSYSWYLWHWPIIVLGSLVLYDESTFTKIILAVISLIPAFVSLHFVETPIRNKNYTLKNKSQWLGYSVCLMVGLFMASKLWAHQTTVWQSSDDQVAIQESLRDLPQIYSMGCDQWYHSADVKVCAFGNEQAEQKVVLLGDSIGAQWFQTLVSDYANDESRLLVVTKSACPMVDEPYYYARIGRMYTECETWRNSALNWLAELKPDMVFLGSSNAEFSEDQWVSGSTRVLEKFAPTTGHVFVLRATPKLDFNGLICLSRRSWQQKFFAGTGNCTSDVVNQYADNVYAWLQKAVSKFDNVQVIDMNDFVCPDGACNAEQNGLAVFRDKQHLTNRFVSTLNGKMKTLVSEYLED